MTGHGDSINAVSYYQLKLFSPLVCVKPQHRLLWQVIPLAADRCGSSPANIPCSWPGLSTGRLQLCHSSRLTHQGELYLLLFHAQERQQGRRGERGGTPGGRQTEPSCWLIHPPKSPSLFSPFGFCLSHQHACCSTHVHGGTDSYTTHRQTHFSSFFSLCCPSF